MSITSVSPAYWEHQNPCLWFLPSVQWYRIHFFYEGRHSPILKQITAWESSWKVLWLFYRKQDWGFIFYVKIQRAAIQLELIQWFSTWLHITVRWEESLKPGFVPRGFSLVSLEWDLGIRIFKISWYSCVKQCLFFFFTCIFKYSVLSCLCSDFYLRERRSYT
jgi:hypothetical protein